MAVSTKYAAVHEMVSAESQMLKTEDGEARVFGHIGDPLDPFGREATRFVAIFGTGSATITALKALRVENISRLQQTGINGTVNEHQINRARS